jgi:NAD(P)-dependent dehydrogenase (short-subunit alcohol dehydrogenase family)
MGLLDGQVAWVTGAGRGIGRATALALADQGATIAIVSRTKSELDRVVEDINARDGKSFATVLDVGDRNGVTSVATRIKEVLGPVDLLINNAGVLSPLGKLWETNPEQWSRLIEINLSGAYYCMRAVLPDMIQRERGVVINISSGVAVSVSPGWSAYAASKAGLDHLTRCLAADLAGTAVRTYALHPSLTDTDMLQALYTATDDQLPPERRRFFADQRAAGTLLSPDVPARVIVWLCSRLCDLDNGSVIDLRSQPEYIEKSLQVLIS